ncbi:MAG TPA: LamG domain-containing protein [Acidimicrobiales bacterium]|nr:LamG domain-containing protein [Acidimicrobiales bacterium]
MDHTMLLLIPLLVFGVVSAFAFAGCAAFTAAPAPPEAQPPPAPPPGPPGPGPGPAPGPTPTPTPPDAYPKLILEENTKSLHGYWRFLEPAPVLAGVTKAKDSRTTAPQNSGTYQGGVTAGADGALRQGSDPADVAAAFNGTDAFVEFAYTPFLNPAADFTIEAWIRPEPLTPGASGVIVGSYTETPVKWGFVLEVVQVDATHMNAQVRIGEASTAYKSLSVSLGDGTAIGGWRYVVATYATQPSPVLSLFVIAGPSSFNDHLPHPGDLDPNYQPVVVTTTSPPMRIGAGWNEPSQTAPGLFFKGRIDEVAIYDKAMVPDSTDPNVHFTIQHHYAVGTTK